MSNNSNIKTTSKNIILYGPPGTGKTYSTVKRAVDIIDGENKKYKTDKDYLNRYKELKEAGLIEFTTFHQSYGYEDFIEGIRPVMGDKDNASDLKYEIHDGVFKAFCKKEQILKEKIINKNIVVKENSTVWAVRPAQKNEEKNYISECISKRYIQYGDTVGVDTFLNEMNIGDMVLLYTGNYETNEKDFSKIEKIKKVGAIGIITGACENVQETNKDYPYRRKVIWLKEIRKEVDVKAISCGGILKITDEKITPDYIIDTFNLADKFETEVYNKVFIIDEINRGNISKIFGELITLIEDTKRLGASDQQSVKLPYSNEDFGVPDNVYIIGTMNTADRSIAALDTALRRRFDFEEMIPNSSLLDGVVVKDVDIKQMLDKINERIEVLYDREHQIGHAYFMELKEKQKEDLKINKLGSIFKYKIIPLLQEYFYEDYEKIRLVLGDNKKAEEFQFIKKETPKYKELFGEESDFDTDELINYSINENAFSKPEAYIKIYKKSTNNP